MLNRVFLQRQKPQMHCTINRLRLASVTAIALCGAVFLNTGAFAAGTQTAHSPVGMSDPTIAFGLMATSDWTDAMPFLNHVKLMRPWIGHAEGIWDAMSYEEIKAGGYLDEHGWLKKIPPGLTSVGTIWDWSNSDPSYGAKASRLGRYVLSYSGRGSIRVWGDKIKVISSDQGRIVFDNISGGMMAFSISQTDPRGVGDYIRDISVVKNEYLPLFRVGATFNPDWLNAIKDARTVRFMDWLNTNGSTRKDWSEISQPDDATWAVKGVPVDVMIQLANEIGADPWFNMPAQASDDFVRQFATHVRDRLSPDLVAHVEYSNETWNWAFDQSHWLRAQADAEWKNSDSDAYIQYGAMRATQVANIWDDVFGDQAATRVNNILAVQTGNEYAAEKELTAPAWAAADPEHFIPPHTVFDSLAITTFFGIETVLNKEMRRELLGKIREPDFDTTAWLSERLMDPDYKGSIPQVEDDWKRMKKLAQTYDLKLIAYEGGQHVHHSFAVEDLDKNQLKVLTEFLTTYVRSPEMGELYNNLWDRWSKVSDGPFMHYGDVGHPTRWGSWGLVASLRDSNPRAGIVQQRNKDATSWFGDGGGERYQQGVIRIAANLGETLVGTDKTDFLIGGPGDDTLIPAKGHDGVNGQMGEDILVLIGLPDEYTITSEAGGYRIRGKDEDVLAVGVEKVRYGDGQEMPMENVTQ
jgi:hypothetical protein